MPNIGNSTNGTPAQEVSGGMRIGAVAPLGRVWMAWSPQPGLPGPQSSAVDCESLFYHSVSGEAHRPLTCDLPTARA